MHIELHGAGFKNKGAQFMLRTTIHELKSRIPTLNLAIDPDYGLYQDRSSFDLLQIFPARLHVGQVGFSRRFLKQRIFCSLAIQYLVNRCLSVELEKYGCITLSSIDAFIDLSGFAYTDQWGIKPTLDLARLTSFYKTANKPVILLPQAFGPFQSKKIRGAILEVVNNSDLIFARDPISYKHIVDVAGKRENLLISPDVTLFYPDETLSTQPSSGNYVCIVPNARMLDQGEKVWGKIYVKYLTDAINYITKAGKRVYIVIHDSSGQDLLLANEILRSVKSSDVRIYQESDSLNLKIFLSKSYFVLGSRYHSLVAAFSNGVPSIALGWSHKYEMLYEDFNSSEYVVSSNSGLTKMIGLIEALLDEDENKLYRSRIIQILIVMSNRNNAMWEQVVKLINSKKQTNF